MADPVKALAIEAAARAEFEASKTGILELAEVDWDTMPEDDSDPPDSPFPSMRCKRFYRDEVSTGIEALARQGFLRQNLGHWMVTDPPRFLREFSVTEFNEALALANAIKDEFPRDPQEGVNVIRAFGLFPGLGEWAAKTFNDTMSVVQEHGGQLEDVGVTMILDSVGIGLCLAVKARELETSEAPAEPAT